MEKNEHIANLFLVIVFFIMITISLWGNIIGITDGSNFEKRNLATAPEVKSSFDLFHYSTSYENYFTDNFVLRNRMVMAEHWIRYTILRQTYFKNVAIADDDWLFLTHSVALDDCQKISYLRNKQKIDLYSGMEKSVEYLAENGISTYFIIAPNKCTIYPEYSAKVFPVLGNTTKTDQLIEYVYLQDQEFPIIDLREYLIEQKDNSLLYFKDDTHWNQLGLFLSHKKIIELLLPEIPEEEYLDISDFSVNNYMRCGDLSNLFGMCTFEDYAENWKLKEDPTSIEEFDTGITIVTNSSAYSDKTLLVFHDSFFEIKLTKVLFGNYFSKVIFLNNQIGFTWNSNKETIQSYINQWEPDIVLIEKVERNSNLVIQNN